MVINLFALKHVYYNALMDNIALMENVILASNLVKNVLVKTIVLALLVFKVII